MKDEDRKRLTIFLGECWHDSHYIPDRGSVCVKCDRQTFLGDHRTFATQADMMALYRRLHEVGEWEEFEDYAYVRWNLHPMPMIIRFNAWLFCLSGEGYEERCQMVNGFLEEER